MSSPSPEKEQFPTSLGCPRQGHFVVFLDGTRGAPRHAPVRDSMHWPRLIQRRAKQLWKTQDGAHGDKQTKAWPAGQQWLVVHHARARCAGSPLSNSKLPRTPGQSPRRCLRTAQPGRWEH